MARLGERDFGEQDRLACQFDGEDVGIGWQRAEAEETEVVECLGGDQFVADGLQEMHLANGRLAGIAWVEQVAFEGDGWAGRGALD